MVRERGREAGGIERDDKGVRDTIERHIGWTALSS